MTQKTFTIRITTEDDAAMTDILDQLSAVMNAAMGKGATIELANDSDAKVSQATKSKPRSSRSDRYDSSGKITCEECGINEHPSRFPRCYPCTAARKRRYAA